MGETAMDAAAVLIVSDRADLPLLLRGPCAARGLRLAWEPDADRGLGPAADAYRLVLLDAAMAGVDAPEAVRAFQGGRSCSEATPVVAFDQHAAMTVTAAVLIPRAREPAEHQLAPDAADDPSLSGEGCRRRARCGVATRPARGSSSRRADGRWWSCA